MKGYGLSGFTGPTLGLLLLLVVGAESWRWGSVASCPPGPEPDCPLNPEQDVLNYFPHPTDCHYYIQCDSSGKAICRRCSPTTYFNPKTFNCVWPLQASCEHNETTRRESLLPPICGPDRECYEEGLTERDYLGCTHYFRCTDGKKERIACPEGKHYNEKLSACDDRCTAGCDDPKFLQDCDNGILIPTELQCNVEGQILKHNCHYYEICKRGYIVYINCSHDQHFDERTGTCVPGSCSPPSCEDKEDSTDCNYYIKNCNQRTKCPEGKHFNKKTKHCENQCTAGCKNPADITACRQCPEEGKIIRYDCDSYTICTQGVPVKVPCRRDQYFDVATGTCTPGSCNRPPTCENREDATDCSYYFKNCNQRTKCPYGQHFNKITKQCEDWCTAGCQIPSDIPECRQCPEEGKILQFDCHSYTICQQGVPVQVTCGLNQYFDAGTGTCQSGPCRSPPPKCEDREDVTDCRYYFTNCDQRSRCLEGQHFNRNSKRCEDQCIAGCQRPSNIPACRQCPEEGKILNYDCHSYTICKQGIPVQVTCRPDQYFDVATGICKSGPCNPPIICEDREDVTDCRYYFKNCDQRTRCPEGYHFNKNSKRCEDQCIAGCQRPSNIPACRQCPEEGKIFNYDCHSYTICKQGIPVQVTCRPDQYFDVATGICKSGPCNPPIICEDREDVTDCRYYFKNCDQRTRCPEGYHFNKNSKRCEDQCIAGCQRPSNIPACRQCPEEGKILNYDCHSYTICKQGIPVQVTCRPDQYFDVATGICKSGPCNPPIICEDREDVTDCRYYFKNCDQRTRCPEGYHFNKNSKRCEDQCIAGCQRPSNIPACRQCPEEGKILNYDCHSYTICKQGIPVKVTCRPDQYFDVATGICKSGPCNPPLICEDREDVTDCRYYFKNCDQRTRCPEGQHFNKNSKRCENQCTAGCKVPSELLGCPQCFEEGKIFQYDCHSYTVCKQGQFQQVRCRPDQHFDVAAGTCISGSCPPPPTCENREDSTDCRYYFINCNERTRCPEGQHFNKLTKNCENQCTAGCQIPSNIPECRQCPDEGKILQYDCHYYIICKQGNPIQVTCRLDQRFDVASGTCVLGSCKLPPSCEDREDVSDCSYYFRNCNQRTQCPYGQHFNKNTKRCENQCTAGCKNPSEIPACRKCKEGEILQYDCHSYTVCKRGNPEKIVCRSDQYFEVALGVCAPGSCEPRTCDDKEDPTDCNYYITKCNQRIRCSLGQHFNRNTKRCEDQCVAGCKNPNEIPGCRQCPEEGKILQYDCHSYTTCTNGIPVQFECLQNQHFDVLTGKCSPGSCNPPSCEIKEDPIDCSYYFKNCNERTKCPEGQHFNKRTKQCENLCTAGCIDPHTVPSCQGCRPEGQTFEDPCSCDMYYKCENGVRILATCEDGLQYNSTTGHCEPPCSNICPKLFARKPECCASTKGKPEPQCPSTMYSVFLPHPSDSRWFYQCLHGVLYCNRCPPGHRWNIDRDTCDEDCQCP